MNDPRSPPPIIAETSGSVAIVTFNQWTQRNSLSSFLLHRLDLVLTSLLNNQKVKTLIFTGTDDVFLAGADIRELALLDSAAALKFAENGQRLFQRIADASQVTVAAINGYCMGGGPVFAHPGARLGIITGWGGTQRLPRLIGKTLALELLLTGRRLNSFRAMEIGLIHAIKDPVVTGAIELIEGSSST